VSAPIRRALLLPAPAIGDGVLALPLARTLLRAGVDVVLHHDALLALAAGLPGLDIEARPKPLSGLAHASFDALFVGGPWPFEDRDAGAEHVLHLQKAEWDRESGYIPNLRRLSEAAFGVQWGPPNCGFSLEHAFPRAARGRVVLQPFSASPSKDWSPKRTHLLGQRLRSEGVDVRVVVAPPDLERWHGTAQGDLPITVSPDLYEVARVLASADVFVGPDSGLGHLASALGVMTVSLFRRASSARFWRPAFSPGRIVLAPLRLPGKHGSRHWAKLVSVGRVHGAVRAMLESRGD
jgi:hypothetical protein